MGLRGDAALTKDGVAAAAREAVADREGQSDRTRSAGAARAVARSIKDATWKSALHDRSVHDPGRAEGRPAAQGERRGDEGEGREVRQLADCLREGGAQLREHRRLGHRRRRSSELRRAHSDHRGRADFSDFQNARQRRSRRCGAAGSTCSSRTSSATPAKWGEEAVQKLKAKPVEVGRYDLVLHPSHLWLTIHESIAHPTELDRAMGYEANYAGTSFVAPPEQVLGKLKYGPEFMNVQGDRSQPGALRDHRLRRRRRAAGRLPDHQERRLQRLPDHARAGDLARLVVRPAGEARRARTAARTRRSWASVQFQRMPNVSLLPGEQRHRVGRPHRRDRPRHRDRRRRLVLDRPAALQRAVRRPGVLRDQRRQDRRAC